MRLLVLLLSVVGVWGTSLAGRVVNVYVWGGEIPKVVLHQFERETGIKVNFSTYDSNETLYAKLRVSGKSIYDVILPSSYFVERMRQQELLTRLDRKKLPNLIHLDKKFSNSEYDPGNQYSVPLTWGATGIFFNKSLVANPPKTWRDLWQTHWRDQLMVLDDPRELFAIALLSLGFDPNDRAPEHIKAAYNYLLNLVPNIKLFASDSIQAIMIDDDAQAGFAWNGDVVKARQENNQVDFVLPNEGFMIWVDCLAIPINPPHPQEAYEFVNFLLKPESAVDIALVEGYAITNAKGWDQLPKQVRTNTIAYPPEEVLKHGYVQRDLGEDKLALYNQYWQQLKLAF
jgi:spermidine/putrescine transport system substrate-binding protein